MKRRNRTRRRFKIVKKSEIRPTNPVAITNAKESELSGETLLSVHSKGDYGGFSILLDQETFDALKPGSIMAICIQQDKPFSFDYCFEFQNSSLTDVLKNQSEKISFDISLSQKVFNVKSRGTQVRWKTLSQTEIESLKLSQVQISFSNQYFSLREIEVINDSLSNKFVNLDQTLELNGFKIELQKLTRTAPKTENGDTSASKDQAQFGFIKYKETIIDYCCLTSRLLFTIEISKEAIEFGNQADLTINSYLNFLDTYYDSYKNHFTVFVFYARVNYPKLISRDDIFIKGLQRGIDVSELNSFLFHKNGSAFRDFYKKVNFRKNVTKTTFLQMIKEQMFSFVDRLPLICSPIEATESCIKGDSEFLGELSSSQNSNLLEVISLYFEGYDSKQIHSNMVSTGLKIISLVAKKARFLIEEYFWRFLKLKLLTNDTKIILVSFSDNNTSTTPTFISIDDEQQLKYLRSKVKISRV